MTSQGEPGRALTLRDSFSYAFGGVGYAIRHERNVRIHLVTALVIIIIAATVGVGPTEWALLLLAMGAVLAAELMNTAVETAVDLACERRFHPLALTAKNVAAGSVLVAAVAAFLVGLIVLGPRVWVIVSGWLK